MTGVCFHTGGRYEMRARTLRRSCETHGLPLIVREMPDHGSWELNCRHKCDVILQAMHDSGDDVLYLDADAELVKPIPPVEYLSIAYPPWKDGFPCIGTIIVRNDPAGREFMEFWKANLDAPKEAVFPPQRRRFFEGTELPGFCAAVTQFKDRVTHLSLDWCASRGRTRTTIILQHQESRTSHWPAWWAKQRDKRYTKPS